MKPLVLNGQLMVEASSIRCVRLTECRLVFITPTFELSVTSSRAREIFRRWMLTGESLSEAVARCGEADSAIYRGTLPQSEEPMVSADNAPVLSGWMLLETPYRADYLPMDTLLMVAVREDGIALEYPDCSYLIVLDSVSAELAERFANQNPPEHSTSRPLEDYWLTLSNPRIHARDIVRDRNRKRYTGAGVLRVLRAAAPDHPLRPVTPAYGKTPFSR